MKKNILLVLLAVGSASALFLTGCSKDDTTPPAISLNGAVSDVISLQGGAYTDPGATATDDEDGSVTVTSDASATNPNPNLVGTYTITYTATDAAGNVGSAVRTVRVRNDAEYRAGNYNVLDVVVGTSYLYMQTISVDNVTNNKIHFSRFCDYANNTEIYGLVNSTDSSISIPTQESGHDIGTNNGGSCDVQHRAFRSTGFGPLTNGFTMAYVDSLTTGVGCAGISTNGNQTYTK